MKKALLTLLVLGFLQGNDSFANTATSERSVKPNNELCPNGLRPIPADIKNTRDLSGKNLSCMDFIGANLYRANLYKADLRGADLSGADLYDADLYKADLREATLRRVDLRRADLYKADLREADLRGADLRAVTFIEADLRGADLRGADLRAATLRRADLHWLNLILANLFGDFEGAKLEGTKWNQQTNFPGVDSEFDKTGMIEVLD